MLEYTHFTNATTAKTPEVTLESIKALMAQFQPPEIVDDPADTEEEKFTKTMMRWVSDPKKVLYWAGEGRATESAKEIMADIVKRAPYAAHRVQASPLIEPGKLLVLDKVEPVYRERLPVRI